MTTLEELVELEYEDEELVPDILPVDTRLSIRGEVFRLISLIERAAEVVPVREIIQNTSHALLEAFSATKETAAYARITATDGNQAVSVINDSISVSMAGYVLIPPKKVLDILKNAPSVYARIEVLGNTCTISSGRARWTLQLPVGDRLPPLPDVEGIETSSVACKDLLKALVVARKAISAKSARVSLLQALIRDGWITGADGARLHRAYVPGLDESLETTIPLRALDELIRALMSTEEDSVEFGANAQHVVAKLGDDVLISQKRLMEYPNVDKGITEAALVNQNTLTVDVAELAGVIKRVRVNSDPDQSAIFLGLIPGKEDSEGNPEWVLAVRARDRLGNAAQEVMDVTWTGSKKARELCVNHKQLSDLLSAFPAALATFQIGDDTKAIRMPLFIEDLTVGFVGLIQQMTSTI